MNDQRRRRLMAQIKRERKDRAEGKREDYAFQYRQHDTAGRVLAEDAPLIKDEEE